MKEYKYTEKKDTRSGFGAGHELEVGTCVRQGFAKSIERSSHARAWRVHVWLARMQLTELIVQWVLFLSTVMTALSDFAWCWVFALIITIILAVLLPLVLICVMLLQTPQVYDFPWVVGVE